MTKLSKYINFDFIKNRISLNNYNPDFILCERSHLSNSKYCVDYGIKKAKTGPGALFIKNILDSKKKFIELEDKYLNKLSPDNIINISKYYKSECCYLFLISVTHNDTTMSMIGLIDYHTSEYVFLGESDHKLFIYNKNFIFGDTIGYGNGNIFYKTLEKNATVDYLTQESSPTDILQSLANYYKKICGGRFW